MINLSLTTAMSEAFSMANHGLLPGPIATLADAAGRALVVSCAVWVGLRLLGARSAVTQKAAWGLVLIGTLMMPLALPWASTASWVPAKATLVVPARTWLHRLMPRRTADRPAGQLALNEASPAPTGSMLVAPSAKAQGDGTAVSPAGTQPVGFPAPAISNAYTGSIVASAVAVPAKKHFHASPSTVAWMVYGAICGALLLRLFYGLGAALGLWQSAEPMRIDTARHLTSGLHVRSSRKVCSPVTVGSGIILPADYHEWDAEKLHIVLAHERSHVRQGDFYIQILAGLYEAFFWFTPLSWWLKRKLSDLSEAISDRAGLDEATSRTSYAQVLLQFAALPRRTQVGVAMARTRRISHRIERLLNESSFRQAFAGGSGRLLAALLLVPAVLFAVTALIRVEAAQTMQKPVAMHGPVIVQSRAENTPSNLPSASTPSSARPAAPTMVAQAPSAPPPPAAPEAPPPPSAPASTVAPAHAPSTPPPPEPPDVEPDNSYASDQDQEPTVSTSSQCSSSHHNSSHTSVGHGYAYSYSSNGDSYALVGHDNKMSFSGDWQEGRREEIERARAMAQGDFLWFTRNGKSYVMDDPQVVGQVRAMYKPMEDLGRRQEELGRQQEALGRQQEELGRQQEEATIPTPDLSKEMAALNAEVRKLHAVKNGTVTQEQLASLQEKLADMEGRLGDLQGEVGTRQDELGKRQGELGRQQGELGRQQGRLGEEQGRLAREADRKVKSIINESLRDGKARHVE